MLAPITQAHTPRAFLEEPSEIEVINQHELILLAATTETQIQTGTKGVAATRRYLSMDHLESVIMLGKYGYWLLIRSG